MGEPRVRIEIDTSKKVTVGLISEDTKQGNQAAMNLFLEIKNPLKRFEKVIRKSTT
jgi:hypothetical protein